MKYKNYTKNISFSEKDRKSDNMKQNLLPVNRYFPKSQRLLKRQR